MSLGITETEIQKDHWAEARHNFIEERDGLIRLAERGIEREYLDIIADWTRVWHENMFAPMAGYPTRKTTFKFHEEAGPLEVSTAQALTKCHELFAELKRQFIAAKGGVDTMGLTHLERRYLRSTN